jgi:hypothetical protein
MGETLPPLYEDAVVCFCGHGLFSHRDYGPCSDEKCNCTTFHGCLVIAGSTDHAE